MSPWASLHCKQWAAKQRDSSLLMRLNRIHLSDALIELGLLQTHTHTHEGAYTHTRMHHWGDENLLRGLLHVLRAEGTWER